MGLGFTGESNELFEVVLSQSEPVAFPVIVTWVGVLGQGIQAIESLACDDDWILGSESQDEFLDGWILG
jgi:hypothetical protein